MTGDLEALERELDRRKTPRSLRDNIRRAAAAVQERPQSAIAAHNLGSALGNAGLWQAALDSVRRAMTLGSDAPETLLVLARGLVELGQFEEAEQAYGAALSKRECYGEAHRELLQLRWMRSGDIDFSLQSLDAVLAKHPNEAGLRLLKAHALETAGRQAEGYELLLGLCRAQPGSPPVLTAAGQAALGLNDLDSAASLITRALDLAPAVPAVAIAYISIHIARGELEKTFEPLAALRRSAPRNQHAIALESTVWRLLGDSRYDALCDYDRYVAEWELAAPPGWSNLTAYMSDLAVALHHAHQFTAHPLDQSIKHGTQVTNVLNLEHPAIRALPTALDPPIRKHLAQLGTGADPLRSRNAGDYAIHGIWSIRMRRGGSHINHVHPEGWLSSACYVEVPELAAGEGELTLGEPGIPTPAPCPPERIVRPAPGKLALFPAYMWHGTRPFGDQGVRLTFALDIVPE